MSRQWVLMGLPNSGKSTLFNRLTGGHTKTGNWPGLTVDFNLGRLALGGQLVRLVDLPGIYDLSGHAEDERVVQRFLAEQTVDLVVFMMSASQLERHLPLAHQIQQLGHPMVLVLNMMDEARQLGIRVDAPAMAQTMGLPVIPLCAQSGEGLQALQRTLEQAAHHAPPHTPPHWQVETVLQQHVTTPTPGAHRLTARLDHWMLHPLWGLPLFLLVFFLLFQSVFTLGKPLQDGLNAGFVLAREWALAPLLSGLPNGLQGFLLDGLFNGLATVSSFVPLIVLFFLAMGLVEDVGYLSRVAYLMDRLMSGLGLDGRAFAMLIMGFGCNVPAMMGTRIIRSRAQRWLTLMMLPFSLCSARLQVFVFFTAIMFSEAMAPWVLMSLYGISFLAAALTAVIFRQRQAARDVFILEMPPYRLPTLQQVWWRAISEVRHFLSRATGFILLGVVLVWALTHWPDPVASPQTTWAAQLGDFLEPVMSPLGIGAALTLALVFGLVAKEVVLGALAIIFGQEGPHLNQLLVAQISPAQAYAFMLFALLYTPCLSTIATIRAETRSWPFTALNLAWGLGLAWLCAFAFYRVATLG